eukprot:GHVH01010941.1.p1 GENE.GHVH01010941.1~~GHVH01010941.1.p1  ORF type:complete len:588 (+),score=85.44 GHVH01010941.1:198-1961(+)
MPKSLAKSGVPSNCPVEWLDDDGGNDVVMNCPLVPNYYHSGEEDATTGIGGSEEPRVQVAPMLAVTDRHFRYMCRLLSRRAQLWTEMVVDATLINCPNIWEHLAFRPVERPLVCQLGGSNTRTMGAAGRLVGEWGRDWCCNHEPFKGYPTRYGPLNVENTFLSPSGWVKGKSVYDEININVGCPSARVSSKGGFGCFLMKHPELVASICQRIIRLTNGLIPLTVKCRLGVDDLDSYPSLANFIQVVSEKGGVRHFIVHARKAWLKGVNPKQNRTLPALMHERVFKLVSDFPHLRFTLNGGVNSIEKLQELMNKDCEGYRLDAEAPEALSGGPLPPKGQSTGGDASSGGLRMEGEYRGLKRSSEWVDLDTVTLPTNASPILTSDQNGLKVPEATVTVGDYPTLVPVEQADPVNTHQRSLSPRYSLFGVMLGRAVLNNICMLARVDTEVYHEPSDPLTASTRRTLLTAYSEYLALNFPTNEGLKATFPLMKPTLSVLFGLPGIKNFRRSLDANCRLPELTPKEVLLKAMSVIDIDFPGILDYEIGNEPPLREIKAHIKMRTGTWEYGADRKRRLNRKDDELSNLNEGSE